jgi:hypothetical protein
MRARVGLLPLLVLVGCSSSTTPEKGGEGVVDSGELVLPEVGLPRRVDARADARREGGGGDGSSPCAPLSASTGDAGAANIAKGASACSEDIQCPVGEFCYVASLACTSPVADQETAGDGTGGHADGGAGCQVPLVLPTSCDSTSLGWTSAASVSLSPGSLVESDAVLASNGSGTTVAAWSTIPNPASGPQQLMQLAVTHNDGQTWNRRTTPSDSSSAATNDGVLAYDAKDGFRYVWEGYESDFQGAQHVWTSVSASGDTWSAPEQVDAPGDYVSGGALDFPWVAVNPVTHLAYVSYEAAPPNTNGTERLVVIDPGAEDAGVATDSGSEGGGAASLALTDGKRPDVYADLARGAFDSSGSYYAAWMEMGDQNTGIGGVLSGSTENSIYFTRVDLSGGDLVPLASNVKVSGANDAVNFDGPSIAATEDGSAVYVSYVVGTAGAVDVVVAKSTQRGATWNAAVKVNDDAHCATHFHSSLLVDPSGRLYVFWYDNRDGQGHFFYAVSDDGGASFHPNRLVSAPAFPFDTFQYSTGWLGDFYEPAIAGGELLVVWNDGRQADQSHVFFSKAALP